MASSRRHRRAAVLPSLLRGRARAINYRIPASQRKLFPGLGEPFCGDEERWLIWSAPSERTSTQSCTIPSISSSRSAPSPSSSSRSSPIGSTRSTARRFSSTRRGARTGKAAEPFETLISARPHRGGPAGSDLSNVPEALRYTKDHEWAKLEGKRARIGITDHAQTELTDVVFVELPPIGKVVKQGEPLGTVESVKAVSEIFAPVSGKVVEVNKALEEKPEIVNKDPYGEGWMVVLETSEPMRADSLMDAAAYRKHIGD